MDNLMNLFNIMLHIDKQIGVLIAQYGVYIYLILFLIIFGETGLVVFPFLPGDSLLFIAGAFAASGQLDPWILTFLLIGAAILGNTVNYSIGHLFGEKVLETHSRWISQETMQKAHQFYEKHGGKAVVMSRFLPVLRTFIPFVAGISEMTMAKFQRYNVLGAVLWIVLFVWGGYFFGHAEFTLFGFHVVVKDYLSTIALVGFAAALGPVVGAFVWNLLRGKKKQS